MDDPQRVAEREGIEAEAVKLRRQFAEAKKRKANSTKGVAMGDDNNAKNQDSAMIAEAEREADLNRRINSAVASQMKRTTKPLLDEIGQLRALLQQRPDNSPNAGVPNTGVSEAARLAEENATLRREAAEQKSRLAREQSNRTLTAALGARGVRPEYVGAVVAMLRERGDLVDTDDGARLTVSKPRGEKKEVQAIEHDDLALAVEDWVSTKEASAFLPAPVLGRRQTPSQPVAKVRAPRTARDAHDLDGMLGDALAAMSPDDHAELTSGPRVEPEIQRTLEALERRGLRL